MPRTALDPLGRPYPAGVTGNARKTWDAACRGVISVRDAKKAKKPDAAAGPPAAK